MQIDMTEEEITLHDTIEFNALNLKNGQPFKENAERAAKLAILLSKREAVPHIRLAVFKDDNYAVGRGGSVIEKFRRNGNSDEQILRHPHFLPWLWYFIHGPKLPPTVIEQFTSLIKELGTLTSGDYETLRHFVRSLTKQFKLNKVDAIEVFKLSLEFSNDGSLANVLRRETLKVAKR